MVNTITDKEALKLINDRKRLIKENSSLIDSYNSFLKDWKRYSKDHTGIKKHRIARSNSAFGLSFRREK